ncbi:MAG: threonylcarbamoyl-AMP synthase [Clostridia bacterium]|nr:threonylcarbamoyl-AMP synthase [Clostridia bacterium]
MNTQLLSVSEEDLNIAATLLKSGELVGIPTETVYGLAADALNGAAVANIFTAKGRPQDNPLIVHIASMDTLPLLVREIPEKAIALADAYWPGPLTMIFPRAACIPQEVCAGLDTVAIRMPSHPIARTLIEKSGCPLAAPSANRSGIPSPTTAMRVMEDMQGRIAAVVDGGECSVGVESTVVDMTQDVPRLLRPGGITPEMLCAVVGEIEIDPAVTKQLENGRKAASPGMKYTHYAPKARVIMLKGDSEQYCRYVNSRAADGVFALCFVEDIPALTVPAVVYGHRDDSIEQAHCLFDALRQLDERGAQLAYAAAPSESGMGLAVYNRMLRAAGFEVIELD